MPRKEVKYYCNICNKVYDNEDSAIECEARHLIPEGISSPEYMQNDNKNIYPYSILVHFKNGKNTRYYRRENY